MKKKNQAVKPCIFWGAQSSVSCDNTWRMHLPLNTSWLRNHLDQIIFGRVISLCSDRPGLSHQSPALPAECQGLYQKKSRTGLEPKPLVLQSSHFKYGILLLFSTLTRRQIFPQLKKKKAAVSLAAFYAQILEHFPFLDNVSGFYLFLFTFLVVKVNFFPFLSQTLSPDDKTL